MPEYEDDVEITSPPYPNVASRAPNLFKLVREFYDWLGEQSHQLVVDVDRHVDQFMSGEEEYRNAHDFQKFVKSALGKKPSCGSASSTITTSGRRCETFAKPGTWSSVTTRPNGESCGRSRAACRSS